MRILIVAATQPEIEPLFAVDSLHLAVSSSQLAVGGWQSAVRRSELEDNNALPTVHSELPTANSKLQTHILITGVGMVATAYALGRHLAANHYDLVLNLGIAGSFDRNLALGEVVEVTSDSFSELGAEDDSTFLPIEQLGFGQSSFNAGTSLAAIAAQFTNNQSSLSIKQVAGITVNTVHGNEQTIQQVNNRLTPQVESMEGAAFFYACHQAGIPGLQIRAVSNYVEKRNRDNWQIGLAIKNLNTFAAELIRQL